MANMNYSYKGPVMQSLVFCCLSEPAVEQTMENTSDLRCFDIYMMILVRMLLII